MTAPCPREQFTTLTEARIELAARRARATLAGTPRQPLEPYECHRCGGAHLRRSNDPAPTPQQVAP